MSPDSVKLTDDESKCRAAGPNLSIIYSYVCGMLPFFYILKNLFKCKSMIARPFLRTEHYRS